MKEKHLKISQTPMIRGLEVNGETPQDIASVPNLPNRRRRVMEERPRIHFYFVNKNKHGKGSVSCCISYKQVRTTQFSLQVRGYAKDWNKETQRFIGKDYEQTNMNIANTEYDLIGIYNELRRLEYPITAETIQKVYLQEIETSTIENATKMYFQKQQKRFDRKEITLETIKNIRARCERFLLYLQQNKLSKMNVTEITPKFCIAYHEYLKSVGYKHDVKKKHLQLLNAVLQDCFIRELIKSNPFAIEKEYVSREDRELIFLSEQELYNLEHYKFASVALQQVADIFLFQCYTGMGYGDVKSFSNLDTYLENDIVWIRKQRGKTKTYFRVPLFPKAFMILEKYNHKLPVLPNCKYNRFLKEVAQILHIDKHLTTHVSRKTFGFMYLNLGLDYETVAAMLGHKSIITTQRMYAKVLTNRIAKKLQEIDINKFIGNSEYLKLTQIQS